ncbi:hypothetical protein CDAR_33081 [Caerostris darwini]|uniref:Uncharacterized protein n=1 Tax=Caerostris darwini TaxID=1538125 RepID=A0AAV4SL50_9ARAC|nr:hypothetical protein CDAR_33081 [Caerostris darwini]
MNVLEALRTRIFLEFARLLITLLLLDRGLQKMKLTVLTIVFGAVFFQTFVALSESNPCNDYVDGILRDLKEDKEYFQDPLCYSRKNH